MTEFHLLYQTAECAKRTRKNGTDQKEIYDKLIEVNSLETFKEAVTHNHTMGMYKDKYRHSDNWKAANVLYADVDSGTTIDEFKEEFKDYEFYIATSKSHLIDKDGTGIHPRFHIYFPIAVCEKREVFKKALIKLCNSKPYFDKAVKDTARFFNASPETCEIYYNEGKSILEYIFSIPDDAELEKEIKEINDFHYDFTPEDIYKYFSKWGLIRTTEGVYDTNAKQWIQKTDLLDLTDKLKTNILIKETGKYYKQPIGRYWLTDERNLTDNPLYNLIEFRPDLPSGRNDINNIRIWNTFNNFKKIEGYEGDITPILNHIKEVICDNDENVYVFVIKWMAHLFQKPSEKPRVALGVRGERQIGKGVIFDELFKLLLGELEFISTDLTCLDSNVNHNIEIRDKLLIYFNEVGWNDRKDIGKMNALITDQTIKYRELRHTPFEGRSFHRVVITTNADRIIEVKDTSVRWVLMTASSKYKGNHKYFDDLRECIHSCYGSFLNYLLSIDISDWNFRDIPLTKTALEQQELSLDTRESFIKALQNGYIPNTELLTENGWYKSSVVYRMYDNYCKEEEGNKSIFSNKMLSLVLTNYYEKREFRGGTYYYLNLKKPESVVDVVDLAHFSGSPGKNKILNSILQQPKNTTTSTTSTTSTNIIKFRPEPDKKLIEQMEKDYKKGDINAEAKAFINNEIPNIECWKHDNTPKAVGSLKAHGYSRREVEAIFSKYTNHILSLALLVYDTDKNDIKEVK
jgi:hypothetical protein